MTSGPRYPALIQSLPSTVPFVGPEVQERDLGHPFRARLGANESVFGPSPWAIAAMQTESAEIWKYADATNFDLKAELAAQMGVTPANILIGEGIDGLLGYVVRLLVAPGDAVVTSDGAYPTFNYHVNGFGGTLHKVPYRGDHEDLDALIARAAEVDAKLVYLSNPDNPMGSWHSGATIKAALDTLPDGTLLVLDEAYIEFAPAGTSPRIDAEDPRVIRMRTFSKGYGMAGARVGYGIGAAPLIRAFDKVRNHFGTNRAAQVGALAALRDQDWLAEVVDLVDAAKTRIATIARASGLTPLPSATNFVAIDCGRDGDFARAVLAGLRDEGVFVRMPFVAPQDRCIRISAGKPADLDVLAEALPVALDAASAATRADTTT
jgi:histidinol-phosphate aminotransferase